MKAAHSLMLSPWKVGSLVDRWLILGPICSKIHNIEDTIDPLKSPFGKYGRGWIANAPLSLHIKERVFRRIWKTLCVDSSIQKLLIRDTPFPGKPAVGLPFSWKYQEVENDLGVDVSEFFFVPTHMETWGFTMIEAPSDATIKVELLSLGPTKAWVRGRRIIETRGPFGYVEPYAIPLDLTLKKGLNPLFIRCAMVGWRESRTLIGLRLLQSTIDLQFGLPIGTTPITTWKEAIAALSSIQIRRFSFPEGRVEIQSEKPKEVEILPRCHVSEEIMDQVNIDRELVLEQEIYDVQNGKLWMPNSRKPNPRYVPLTLRFKKKGMDHPWIDREVFIPTSDWRDTPYGSYKERKREALEELSLQEYDVMGSLARIELGKTEELGKLPLSISIDFLKNRKDCADFHALALLLALYKYKSKNRLPAQQLQAIQDALVSFKYWHDEPGVDAMCWFTENHQIIFHTAAYLAGSYFPSEIFTNSGRSGKELATLARQRILRWIQPRFSGGYSEWDSNTYLAMDIYALLLLVEYAASTQVQQWANALLQKTFFMIGCHSLRGSHGCSHGRCYASGLKTSRVESTAGLQRIAWGLGGFDCETWAMGTLALCERFVPHPLICRLAVEPVPLLETKVASYGTYHLRTDLREGEWEVNTLCRRTPEYLLSAALDLRPADRGIQEHLWQLTFSPEAVIFTTWPGNGQEHGNARPNFWAGSARLPRVVMEDRFLVCMYDPQFTGGLGYGHAYFPTDAFEEVRFHDAWIFARYSRGYAAVRGDSALLLTEGGKHAGQELRTKNGGRIWLAAAGSEREDGSFNDFQERLIQSSIQMEPGRVHWKLPHYKEIVCAWDGPIWIDGKQWIPRFNNHYENIFCQMPRDSHTLRIRGGKEEVKFQLTRQTKGRKGESTDL